MLLAEFVGLEDGRRPAPAPLLVAGGVEARGEIAPDEPMECIGDVDDDTGKDIPAGEVAGEVAGEADVGLTAMAASVAVDTAAGAAVAALDSCGASSAVQPPPQARSAALLSPPQVVPPPLPLAVPLEAEHLPLL